MRRDLLRIARDGFFVIVIVLVIVIAVRHAVLGPRNGDHDYGYEYEHETAQTAGRSIGLANVRRLFMNNPAWGRPPPGEGMDTPRVDPYNEVSP